MPPKGDSHISLLYSHEDRLQFVESAIRNLEVATATTSANLQSLTSRVDVAVDHIVDKIDHLKNDLCDKIKDVNKAVENIDKKDQRIKEKWAEIWPKVIVYFLTSAIGGGLTLIAHEFVVRPHMK